MASDVDKPSLSLCKGFITNVVKRIDSHNRIKTDKVKIRHREFENTVRKEYTQKNLHLKHSNTMYSDLIQQRTISTNRKKVITPRQQVEKLVSDAANFDKTMEAERSQPPVRKKGRIVLNKTLLMNHLKHTSAHNRLKEEDEMWEQHSKQQKRNIALVTSKNKVKRKGTMYSDREPHKTKPQRITVNQEPYSDSDSPVEIIPKKPYFGKYTKQLLELKEKDKDKWGHSGFKEIYGEETESEEKPIQRRIINKKDTIERKLEKKQLLRKNKQPIKASAKETSDFRKVLSTSATKETIKPKSTKIPLKTLHADEIEVEDSYNRVKNKTKRKIEKWGEEHSDLEISPIKKRIRSCAVIKKDVIDVKSSEDEWEEKDIIITGEKEKGDDVIVVDRTSLKKSIHEENGGVKKKKRLVLSARKGHLRKKGDSNKYVQFKSATRRVIKPKSYASDRESRSSFTDSSGDERYRKIQKKHKLTKYKSTFSDYDSDFEQR